MIVSAGPSQVGKAPTPELKACRISSPRAEAFSMECP
jgi:hypothetical protein